MEFFWEMLSLQETMFLLILTGVLIKKLKIIDAAGRKMLSDLLIDVILPCNIVESFSGGMAFPDGFARNCLLAVGLSAVIQLMSTYGSKLLFRKYPGSREASSPTASSAPTPALWGCRWPACCSGTWA